MRTPKLKGKRILITGAAGFIGSHLTHSLVQENAEIHALVSPTSDLYRLGAVKENITIWRGDIRDRTFIKNTCKETMPHIVYHLSDYGIHPQQTNLEEMVQTNIVGLTNLLQALEKVPFDCLVNSGSSAEYGPRDHAMEEGDLLRPENAYGAIKAAGTLLTQSFGKLRGRKVITLRLFYVYGPHDSPTRFLPTAIRACLEGSELKLSSRQEKRDFVYVEDVVQAFLLAASNDIKNSHVINIGTSIESNLGKIVHIIERNLGSKIQIRQGAYQKRPWDSPCWAADIRRAQKLLGWVPAHDLETGLHKTIASLRPPLPT
jgi:nucleoside-diphosphate-sugar epimerase